FYFPFKAHPTTLPGLVPFSRDFQGLGRHNSHGFRAPEYTIARPANTFRILIIGDSITYGMGVLEQETYPQILERLLKQQCPNLHPQVIPLGVTGHRLADMWIELLAHGQSLKPDLVVFQIAPTDINFFGYFNILSAGQVPDIVTNFNKKEMEVFSEGS